MGIKAIETKYNGFNFRSRLEARWAIFFDMIGLKYEYEVEGYEMNGVRYLPDFYIPSLDRWFEIKAKPLSEYEMKKCEEFCFNKDNENIKFSVLIGSPEAVKILLVYLNMYGSGHLRSTHQIIDFLHLLNCQKKNSILVLCKGFGLFQV